MQLTCDLWRTVEREGSWALQGTIPGDSDDFSLLESFVEETKPRPDIKQTSEYKGYHFLIYTPFRYELPVDPRFVARFRPPYFEKNVFYGACSLEATVHEAAFYFMRERRHLTQPSGSAEPRLTFTVSFHDPETIDIRNHPLVDQIMDRSSYEASHAFVRQNSCDSILYPSARDPGGECVAVFEISHLGKTPKTTNHYRYQYLKSTDTCAVHGDVQENLYAIAWGQVC